MRRTPVGTLPRCMHLIRPAAEVIRRIELYFAGGALSYLGGQNPYSPGARATPRRNEARSTH